MQGSDISVRLAYRQCSLLKQLNYRESRELANSLNYLDYNESLETVNRLILLNSVDSTESTDHEQCSGSPEHQHCSGSEVPTNNAEICGDDGKFNHEENQKYPDLEDGHRLL